MSPGITSENKRRSFFIPFKTVLSKQAELLFFHLLQYNMLGFQSVACSLARM